MGFAQAGDDEIAFTEADVDALRQARELIDLGILSPERQAALVRTWGRSFARLAEWQTSLLATVAVMVARLDVGGVQAAGEAAEAAGPVGISSRVRALLQETAAGYRRLPSGRP